MKHIIRKFKRGKFGCTVEDVKLVQCEIGTGLRDRGGFEIIEGDIVICEGFCYPVVYHDCEFFLQETGGDLPLSSFDSFELEIVGHIAQD